MASEQCTVAVRALTRKYNVKHEVDKNGHAE